MTTPRSLPLATAAAVASRTKHVLWTVWVSTRLLSVAERVVLRRRSGHPRADPDPAGEHVLLGPPGGGNIGDQAMVEAFIEQADGPVVVVEGEPGSIVVPPSLADRGRVVSMPALVYGGGVGHLRDVLRLDRLLDGAASLSVVGADLMDGGYGYRGAVTLARTAATAARNGLPTRVLGFSWNTSPDPRARRAMRRASHDGVRLVLRDPLSARRARADGIRGVVDGADIVFSATQVDPAPASAPWDHGDRVVVNISGLVNARRDLVGPFSALVAHLRERGLEVVLLPHVRRPGGDDLAVCRQVAALFTGDAGVHLVDGIVRPAQVRSLVEGAQLVVTGRMHLAIIALSRGVPAVCLSTQGKVEGLMRLFGTEDLCVAPDDTLEERLPLVVDDALDARDELVARIAQRSPAIRRLSLRNVEGL